MTIGEKYRKTAEGIITQVDFQDIFNGISYKNIYGCGGSESGVEIFFATPQQIYANPLSTSGSYTLTGGWQDVFTRNFDLDIRDVRILSGAMFAEIPIHRRLTTISSGVDEYTVKLDVQRIDNAGASTSLITMSGVATGSGTANWNQSGVFTLRGEVANTKFIGGNKLRLAITPQVRRVVSTSDTGYIVISCDPKNRINTEDFNGAATTQLNFYVPMKSDL